MTENSQSMAVEQMRSAEEVARRCVVLYAVLAAGHDEPRDELVAWLHREGLWDAVSPRESEFLLAAQPTRQQRVNATWRSEALFPLLWSLGLMAELPEPRQLCDVQLMRGVLLPLLEPVAAFVTSARLRDEEEVHATYEETYHIHWRIRNAKLREQPTPLGRLPRMPVKDQGPPVESYRADAVQERHYALNWLIGYCGQAWDDVTTDT